MKSDLTPSQVPFLDQSQRVWSLETIGCSWMTVAAVDLKKLELAEQPEYLVQELAEKGQMKLVEFGSVEILVAEKVVVQQQRQVG